MLRSAITFKHASISDHVQACFDQLHVSRLSMLRSAITCIHALTSYHTIALPPPTHSHVSLNSMATGHTA
eukprot:591940-Rhodomonas_salina.1